MKLNLNQWLFKQIDYENNYYIKDILNEIFSHITNFVNRYEEIKFDYESETRKQMFYTFVYEEFYLQNESIFAPYNDEMYEYFSLKFSKDIVNLF